MTMYHFYCRNVSDKVNSIDLKCMVYDCNEGKVKYSLHSHYGNTLINKSDVGKVSGNGYEIYLLEDNPEKALALIKEGFQKKMEMYQNYINTISFDGKYYEVK